MASFQPRMYLPRPDGTKDVFCERSYITRKPCNSYVKLTNDGQIMEGFVVSSTGAPIYLCSSRCTGLYYTEQAKRVKKVG